MKTQSQNQNNVPFPGDIRSGLNGAMDFIKEIKEAYAIEKDAKNMAYAFILERCELNAFASFCELHKGTDPHNLATSLLPSQHQSNVDRRPIGFVHYGNYPTVAQPQPSCDQSSQNPLSNNPYFTAMMNAVQEFINGELNGHAYTIERLKDKMKAANTLFLAEHREMERQYRTIKA